MLKESSERRFPPITLPAVLVLVLALGTVAIWYVVLNRASAAPAPVAHPGSSASAARSAAPSPSPTPTVPPDPTAGWTRYADTADTYSLRYPTTWQQRTCNVDGHVSLYLAPAPAALGSCNSGYVGQMYVIPLSGDQRSTYELGGSGYLDLVSQNVTVAGVNGQRQAATVGSSPELTQPVGTRVVQYVFYAHSRTYVCYYGQAPSGATSTDVLSDFDLMVANTLTFAG